MVACEIRALCTTNAIYSDPLGKGDCIYLYLALYSQLPYTRFHNFYSRQKTTGICVHWPLSKGNAKHHSFQLGFCNNR